MTLRIELAPEEKARLEATAQSRGMRIEECARRLIMENLPAAPPEDPTLALFAQWEAEDATDDPDELAARNREWEEFRDRMNATRREAGARTLYP